MCIANSNLYILFFTSMSKTFEGVCFFDSPEKYISDVVLETPAESSTKKHRDFGRWTIKESQVYLEVLRKYYGKDVIKELRKALPARIESQIRAHHQKMLKKYGTIEQILQFSDHKDNKKLIEINSRLQSCLSRLKEIVSELP